MIQVAPTSCIRSTNTTEQDHLVLQHNYSSTMSLYECPVEHDIKHDDMDVKHDNMDVKHDDMVNLVRFWRWSMHTGVQEQQ